MGKHTPFYDLHVQANAKIVDFAGWDMPLHYGSQLQEHHQVRQAAGMFDVSHMGIVDIQGSATREFLRRLLANNVDRLVNGKALYTCMLNDQGGILDDLIVYKVTDDLFRIIVNAGTREKDLAWMRQKAQGLDLSIIERTDLLMLAVQGPLVKEYLANFFPEQQMQQLRDLKPFNFSIFNDMFIARTGYTGEDGFEIIADASNAAKLWNGLLAANIKPCGLGARDTLRLEAGLNLYGSDMDETVTPYESNLGWTVVMDPPDRQFIGRKALEEQKKRGIAKRLVGLVLEGPGIIRNHQHVKLNGDGEGVITSGGYSPTLEKSIALARIPGESDAACVVEIRNKTIPAKIVKPPFVKHGQKLI